MFEAGPCVVCIICIIGSRWSFTLKSEQLFCYLKTEERGICKTSHKLNIQTQIRMFLSECTDFVVISEVLRHVQNMALTDLSPRFLVNLKEKFSACSNANITAFMKHI